MNFENKVVVITGGASGIGLALARALLQAKARVTIVGRTASKVEDAVRTLSAEGPVEGAVADVTDADGLDKVLQQVMRTHGRIDILVNNAGISIFGEIRDQTRKDWNDIIDINIRGVVHGIQSVYPAMIRQGFGHIVNVASLAGIVPATGAVPYTATKCAVVGLSQALRLEAERYGVKVSVVCPGAVMTPIIDTSPYRGLDRDAFLAAVPGKPDEPDDFARKVLRGIARNKEVIAPGFAGVLWRMHRYAPFVSRMVMRKMGALVAKNRDIVALKAGASPSLVESAEPTGALTPDRL